MSKPVIWRHKKLRSLICTQNFITIKNILFSDNLISKNLVQYNMRGNHYQLYKYEYNLIEYYH
jgi:hypothetical protein